MMPHDCTPGFFAWIALTKPGSFLATPGGGFFWKKPLRLSCFSLVLGGYLGGGKAPRQPPTCRGLGPVGAGDATTRPGTARR